MKSMLVSIPRTDILFMPILRLNEKQTQTAVQADGSFVVAVDADTQDNSSKGLTTSIGYVSDSHQQGVLFGNNPEIEVSTLLSKLTLVLMAVLLLRSQPIFQKNSS